MKYLLDTHVLLWALFEPNKILEQSRALFLDDENEFYISPISLWEISLKFSIKKLTLQGISPEGLLKYFKLSGFFISDLEPNLILSYHRLPNFHKDPFDRMLIWQAINKNYILLSADKDLAQYEKKGLKLVRA